jgi:hypothetical protein
MVAGSFTYTVVCSGGSLSAQAQQVISVAAASGSGAGGHGGGGSLNPMELSILAALALILRRRTGNIGLRDSIMFHCEKYPSTLVLIALLSGFLANVSRAGPDQAAQDRCTQYAQRAVQQYLLTTSRPQCNVKPDLRWQDNFDNHYSGCLKLPEFLRKSEEAARDNHLQACGGLTEMPAAAAEAASIPAAINETENTHSHGVLIFRRNRPNSSSPGLIAIYTGQIAGNKVINGVVTWSWKGFPKGVAQGTWNASW